MRGTQDAKREKTTRQRTGKHKRDGEKDPLNSRYGWPTRGGSFPFVSRARKTEGGIIMPRIDKKIVQRNGEQMGHGG